jgi:hypothetical protein
MAKTEDHGGVTYRGGERWPTGGSWTIGKLVYRCARVEAKQVDRRTSVRSVPRWWPMVRAGTWHTRRCGVAGEGGDGLGVVQLGETLSLL